VLSVECPPKYGWSEASSAAATTIGFITDSGVASGGCGVRNHFH
jgi:hypothetical protein